MSDTISIQDDLWIDPIDPFSGRPWTESEIQAMREGQARQERVRQRLVKSHSSSPLYQAMAAKDPEYWNKFYVSRAI